MEVAAKSDVVIVGGGPAGSTLAALLAMRGVEVTLLDRDTFPRDKVCGEFLSYDALPFLQRIGVTEAIDEKGATDITRCRVYGSRRSFSFDLPVAARGISRVAFDDLLLRRARNLGANVVQEAAVESAERQAAGWKITYSDRERVRHTVSAPMCAGAWGRWGRLDRQLGRDFVHDHAQRHFGFKRHYTTAARATPTIDLYSFHAGYLGVSPIEGGATNICGLVHESRLEGARGGWVPLVASFASETSPLTRLFASHEPLQDEFLSTDPVIFAAKEPVVDGMLLIGDASGLVDPLAGNGMAMAIQSAFLAAKSILAALARGNSESAAAEYRESHRATFRNRIAWSRRAAWLLSRPEMLERALLAARPSFGEFLLRRTRADGNSIERLLQF